MHGWAIAMGLISGVVTMFATSGAMLLTVCAAVLAWALTYIIGPVFIAFIGGE